MGIAVLAPTIENPDTTGISIFLVTGLPAEQSAATPCSFRVKSTNWVDSSRRRFPANERPGNSGRSDLIVRRERTVNDQLAQLLFDPLDPGAGR